MVGLFCLSRVAWTDFSEGEIVPYSMGRLVVDFDQSPRGGTLILPPVSKTAGMCSRRTGWMTEAALWDGGKPL